MGAWGHKSFENDTALDWICELKPSDAPFAYPMSAIDKLLESDLYIDAPEGEEAIAAAQGNPPQDPPEELEKWHASLGEARPTQDMIERATQALRKVRNDEQSEIRELWKESEYFNDWQASIDDLITRLLPQA